MRQLKITKSITNRESASLDKYLQEIGREELITVEEEVELAQRIKKGDKAALEKLTRANLRFVVSVAKQYQNQGLALNDLINEGNIGLIKAAQRFDESKGFKFISYAVWWIRQSIMQALVEHSRMVRLPLNKIGSYSKINKIMIRFEQNFEREPSKDELAEILNVSVRDVEEMLKGMTRHTSMDAPVGEDEKATMADLTPDSNSRTVMDDLYGESLKREVNEMLSGMNPRDSAILSCFFGINGEEQMGLDEIGKRFHLTKERVRQIKEKAIRKLRKSGYSQSLKAYLGR